MTAVTPVINEIHDRLDYRLLFKSLFGENNPTRAKTRKLFYSIHPPIAIAVQAIRDPF